MLVKLRKQTKVRTDRGGAEVPMEAGAWKSEKCFCFPVSEKVFQRVPPVAVALLWRAQHSDNVRRVPTLIHFFWGKAHARDLDNFVTSVSTILWQLTQIVLKPPSTRLAGATNNQLKQGENNNAQTD
jgi:hypothetical protein